MQYRTLGRSGLRVSPVCLGTMMFGGPTDEPTAARIVAQGREAGVNFVDTADAYTEGRSEEIVGRAVKADRSHWIVATKLANPTGPGPNDRGLSRKHVVEGCEASLRRLDCEHIDILYLHKEDHGTPLGETVRALADLVRAGKIRHVGLSNYRGWRVAEICRLADEMGIDRPVVSQPSYNVLNRMPEAEHLPACGHYGLGVFPYSPLARGVLTAKYAVGETAPAESRAGRADKRMMETEWRPESLAIARRLREHAEACGTNPVAFAVGWLLANPLVTGFVAGPRTEAQWRSYLDAPAYRFTREDEALVNELVPAGHPSTPGYSDPAYPLEGRPVRF